jgi:hypothetical protein
MRALISAILVAFAGLPMAAEASDTVNYDAEATRAAHVAVKDFLRATLKME